MLSAGKKGESLAGKWLLSSALVALSLAYGWWQRQDVNGPKQNMTLAPLAPKKAVSMPSGPAAAPATPVEQPATPDTGAVSGVTVASNRPAAGPQTPAPNAATAAIAPVAPETAPQQNAAVSSSLVSAAPVMQAPPPNILPVESNEIQPFLITGTPGLDAKSPVPAGMHLEDGDYISSRHQFMWGDLRIKIFVRGGSITGVQALQFPDHRSQSLYLSGLALPKLESEVIRKQTAQVDTVSSATDTSIVFQDAVADAITRATRG